MDVCFLEKVKSWLVTTAWYYDLSELIKTVFLLSDVLVSLAIEVGFSLLDSLSNGTLGNSLVLEKSEPTS